MPQCLHGYLNQSQLKLTSLSQMFVNGNPHTGIAEPDDRKRGRVRSTFAYSSAVLPSTFPRHPTPDSFFYPLFSLTPLHEVPESLLILSRFKAFIICTARVRRKERGCRVREKSSPVFLVPIHNCKFPCLIYAVDPPAARTPATGFSPS